MADLHLEWMKPIRLAKSGKHSLTIDTTSVPNSAGVYTFFRRTANNKTEVIYVGQGERLQRRINWHKNNHALITALIKKSGIYYLMPGIFKALPGQNSKKSIKTIERVLIRNLIDDGHPLINTKGILIRTQHVVSTVPAGAKFLNQKIGFERRKADRTH